MLAANSTFLLRHPFKLLKSAVTKLEMRDVRGIPAPCFAHRQPNLGPVFLNNRLNWAGYERSLRDLQRFTALYQITLAKVYTLKNKKLSWRSDFVLEVLPLMDSVPFYVEEF